MNKWLDRMEEALDGLMDNSAPVPIQLPDWNGKNKYDEAYDKARTLLSEYRESKMVDGPSPQGATGEILDWSVSKPSSHCCEAPIELSLCQQCGEHCDAFVNLEFYDLIVNQYMFLRAKLQEAENDVK